MTCSRRAGNNGASSAYRRLFLISDPVLGFRFALGTSFYFDRFYIGPEISYHVARYTDWSCKPEDGGSFDFESDEIGDVVLFLLKLGYHFRR